MCYHIGDDTSGSKTYTGRDNEVLTFWFDDFRNQNHQACFIAVNVWAVSGSEEQSFGAVTQSHVRLFAGDKEYARFSLDDSVDGRGL